MEELGVGRVHLGRTLLVCLLVRRDVLVVLQLLHLQPGHRRLERQLLIKHGETSNQRVGGTQYMWAEQSTVVT